MHFGEYELFPSLIGLSPLPTGHPKTFQRQRVRSSTMCYHSFNLPMGRSHGFASATTNLSALFRLAFAAAPPLKGLTCAAHHNSLAHYAKGTPSPPKGLRLIVSIWFQVLFHSPSGVLFTFPSRYWFTIGHESIFSLIRWSGQIPTRFHVPRGTRVC